MYGRTNAGGGVSAKGFIQTTYPEGSICTCSNGTRTLQARDTSGYMMFILPAIGTWTVTATDPADPTNTDSETVEITKEGESVSVKLSYRLWLYKEGNEYTDITGGWEKRAQNNGSGGSLTKGISSMTVTGSSNTSVGGCGGGTVNVIDLREISTIYINVLAAANGSAKDTAGYALVVSEGNTNPALSNALAGVEINETTLGTMSFDVSNVDEGVVCIIAYSGKGQIEYNRVWCK